jgi:hypothetical protein
MRSVTMTTQKPVTWASWRWVNPLWWAERQLEATRFAVHATAAVFDASLSSVYGPLWRVRPGASTYSAADSAPGQQAAATVTAMMAVAPWERQLEAAKPHRELEPAVPESNGLKAVTPQAGLDLITPQADRGLVTGGVDLEAVILDTEPAILDTEPATAGPGPDVATAEPPAAAEPAPGPQAVATEVHEADGAQSTPPVPGWDELTLGSIRARLRRLSVDDLTALHSYEEAHGARADVLSMLENRLAKVRSAEQAS